MAFVIFVVIVGVSYQQLVVLRAATLTETHRQVARLNVVMAEQTGRAMETIDFILHVVMEQRRTANPESAAERDSLRRRISGVHQLLAVKVTDADGHIVISTRGRQGGMLSPTGQAMLLQHAADQDLGMKFSEPMRQGDGNWTVLVTERINGPNKHFDGIAVGILNLAYFEDFYKAVDLSQNGSITLRRRDGVVLAHYPHNEPRYGESPAELAPFRDVPAHNNNGTLEMEGSPDQSRRIASILPLRAFPLTMVVSVDEQAVLTGWRYQTLIFAFGSIGCALVIAALMLLLAHRSRRMQGMLAFSMQARGDAEAANARLLVQMEERERTEQALRQSQRAEAVGQLTGGVAHDFNNLLTILMGNIELMQSHPAAASFANRLFTMRAAVERGGKLTNHLLAFARRQPLQPRSVDLAALIHDIEPLLASVLGTKINLMFDLDATASSVHVDRAQIELIVLNIALNARDAMPAGGTLRITTRPALLPGNASPDSPPAGHYLSLRMTDTGTGMDPEVRRQAFDPYFTTKTADESPGLGLSQVFGIAQNSGGQVSIESVLGHGTTVEVHLPCCSQTPWPPQHKPADTTRRPARGSHATILVVDDDHAVRSTTAMLLRRSGYNVTEADTGEKALAILGHDGSIGLLLSDVVMPSMNGTELAAKASVLRPELSILFVSGYADPQAIAGAIPLSRLMRKPCRPSDLIRRVETALAESRDKVES